MPLPLVIADTPLDATVTGLLSGQVEILPWSAAGEPIASQVLGLYTYGHPLVDAALLDRLPGLKVVSNYGVGVDHIRLPAAKERGIPVGNTPGILDGATADMGMTLLLAAARRLAEGDRYARSPEFTRYDPGYMLGREVHSSTLGIIGLGRIGQQVARRARAFDMQVVYHNRRRNEAAEATVGATYVSFDGLLVQSDFVMLCCPLTDETRGLIGIAAFARMKPTAILVNIARGPVVDTAALTQALQTRHIYSAALDVTDPEPLPRDHPLLTLDNVTIAPHLGSATEQTRRQMAEISVENLLRGMRGQELLHRVV
ncbi:MAG: 2-hydroxyacid dehydrogenase [Pirellulaceae bacterium]